MPNKTTISGNNNISIQGVSDSTITLNVNGNTEEIKNELSALKEILTKNGVNQFRDKFFNYPVDDIDEDGFGFITGKKNFNQVLTRKVIDALQPYSKPAKKFLEKASAIDENWDGVDRISNQGKEIIAYSFVGVIGVQIRKLMAIGKEEDSEKKVRKYINHATYITKRILQLLNFCLLSELWNQQKIKTQKLSEDEEKTLAAFFTDTFEMDIRGMVQLFQTLWSTFQSAELKFPLSELQSAEVSTMMKPGSPFLVALENLQEIKEQLDKGSFSLITCFAVEKQLTVILETVAFLANYRMVSIKSIAYEEMRNRPPKYLHSYANLGMDKKFNVNTEKMDYHDKPASTEAVLLYNENFLDSINLFPFIIDVNALRFESGSKICFYNFRDLNDGSLNYQFVEDNTNENIVFSESTEKQIDVTSFMKDKDARVTMRMDHAFLEFEDAQKTMVGSGQEVELTDLFDED